MLHMTGIEGSDLQPRLSSMVPRKAVEQRQAVRVHSIGQLQPEAGHQRRVAAGHLLRIGRVAAVHVWRDRPRRLPVATLPTHVDCIAGAGGAASGVASHVQRPHVDRRAGAQFRQAPQIHVAHVDPHVADAGGGSAPAVPPGPGERLLPLPRSLPAGHVPLLLRRLLLPPRVGHAIGGGGHGLRPVQLWRQHARLPARWQLPAAAVLPAVSAGLRHLPSGCRRRLPLQLLHVGGQLPGVHSAVASRALAVGGNRHCAQ